MAHVGQELRLGAVGELGALLGADQRLLALTQGGDVLRGAAVAEKAATVRAVHRQAVEAEQQGGPGAVPDGDLDVAERRVTLAAGERHELGRGLCRQVVQGPADDLARMVAEGVMHPRRHEGEDQVRSEEHMSELQSLMRISYAVFCLNKKNNKII